MLQILIKTPNVAKKFPTSFCHMHTLAKKYFKCRGGKADVLINDR